MMFVGQLSHESLDYETADQHRLRVLGYDLSSPGTMKALDHKTVQQHHLGVPRKPWSGEEEDSEVKTSRQAG